jgi:hypothetical protein
MAGIINKIINLAGNMGWRYVSFRARYELLRRSGLLKSKFPAAPSFKQYITLQQWKDQQAKFFFSGKVSLDIPRNPSPNLKETFDNIRGGKIMLFNSVLTNFGTNYDWLTNPDNGYCYDVRKHWTEIADYSPEAGDIKFVWEKSRFSYLYDIIRYDYHFNEDCAELVFADILSWIKANPVNCGPNYRCSQEMSLRVLNWTFALHYYRDSPALTAEVFDQVQYAIYWHMDHVYKNIDFSRIAVRNNHAITETLGLYLVGLLFPLFPDAAKWKADGKRWFEKEIAYQVYADGTYLQFSMNYHRVVIQLLTWAIKLSELNGERFNGVVYERATKSVQFLRTCMIDESGWLPNYGANDGALFFKLSDNHFRDYRPQLQALAGVLEIETGLGNFEDNSWYGTGKAVAETFEVKNGIHSFKQGGYYIIREPDTLTFIKCGSYKDRPSHADNLHIDIWYKGENILLDAGSYKYNTDAATMRYFSGTASHNTVMLDDKDQMLKGGRFIWYHWSRCMDAKLEDEEAVYSFLGTANVFRYVKDNIMHRRKVIKHKNTPIWEIRDEVIGAPQSMNMRQLWHYPRSTKEELKITAKDGSGAVIVPVIQEGWYSPLYAQKEKTEEIVFGSGERVIDTIIKIV